MEFSAEMAAQMAAEKFAEHLKTASTSYFHKKMDEAGGFFTDKVEKGVRSVSRKSKKVAKEAKDGLKNLSQKSLQKLQGILPRGRQQKPVQVSGRKDAENNKTIMPPQWKRKKKRSVSKSRKYKRKLKRSISKSKRSSYIRPSKYQSKFFKKLKQRNKYLMTINNEVNPEKAGCVINTFVDSYDSKYDMVQNSAQKYDRMLTLDTNHYLQSSMNQTSGVYSYPDVQPVDRHINQKLGPYTKARINAVKVTITFQFFGTFDGYVFMLPCLKGQIAYKPAEQGQVAPNPPVILSTTGNGVPLDSGLYHKFHESSQDGVQSRPKIELENAKLQNSIKVKKIIERPGTRIPKIHKLSMKIRLRDLDLTLKNKEEYNDKYKMRDIIRSGDRFDKNSYYVDWNTQAIELLGQQSNLAFGFRSNTTSFTAGVDYCRMTIAMKQYCQLQEPPRISLGNEHKLT